MSNQHHEGKKKPTLKTIADACGVQPGTVSRVLNNISEGFSVKKEKHELILKVAAEMNYVPNTAARSLRKRRFDLVLVYGYNLPSFLPMATYGSMLGAMSDILNENGFQVHIALPPGKAYKVSPMSCDGVVFVDVSDEDYIREFSARGFPRVILNDKLTHCSWVAVDDRHGMFRLLNLLEGLGHKRIAYRCNHRGYHLQSHSSLVDRFEAYSEWMTERGIPLTTDHSIKMSDDAFLDSIRSLGCTAVVCYDEKNALSLYRTCGEVGIRIPEDLSLVGFDEPVNYALLPKITSMWQPAKEMGEIAAELLLAQMNGTLKSPGHHLLKLHYHEGETLAPPKSP